MTDRPLFNDDLYAGLNLLYSNKAQTLTGGYADEFLVANLVFTYEHLLPGLEGSVGLYNLFDTHYGYPGAGEHVQDVIDQDGFSIIGRLTYRFK